jgi:hypothetical protein
MERRPLDGSSCVGPLWVDGGGKLIGIGSRLGPGGSDVANPFFVGYRQAVDIISVGRVAEWFKAAVLKSSNGCAATLGPVPKRLPPFVFFGNREGPIPANPDRYQTVRWQFGWHIECPILEKRQHIAAAAVRFARSPDPDNASCPSA